MTPVEESVKRLNIEKKNVLRKYKKALFTSLFQSHSEEYREILKTDKDRCASDLDACMEFYDLINKLNYVTDPEELDKVLNKIERIYYDCINYYSLKCESGILFSPDELGSTHLSNAERQSLIDEITGLRLSDSSVDEYFRNGVITEYLRQNTKYFNGGYDLSYYGAYPLIEDGIVRRVKLVVPHVRNLETALVNVHEFRHGFDLYDLIGKEYPEENDFEERARAEENQFITEYVRKK